MFVKLHNEKGHTALSITIHLFKFIYTKWMHIYATKTSKILHASLDILQY